MPSHSLPSARRLAAHAFPVVLPILGLLLGAPTLRADPITYTVKLSPTQGAYGGTGTLTVSAAPSSSGITTYSQKNGNLQGLSFTIDGQTFSLADDLGASVEFLNGNLYNISFADTVGNYPNRFTLDTSGGYAFYYNQYDNGYSESYGNITALAQSAPTSNTPATTPAPATSTTALSTTPEPGSLVLLATALLGAGFLLFRRKRNAES